MYNRIATKYDIKELKQDWLTYFSHDSSPAYIDWFFANIFALERTLIIANDQEIICSAQWRVFEIILTPGHKLKVGLIFGVITKEKYWQKGFMKKIMNQILMRFQNENILPVIQAYNWDIYRGFGFTDISFKHFCQINWNIIPQPENLNKEVFVNPDSSLLVNIYQKFLHKNFFFYSLRDEKRFDEIKTETNFFNQKIFANKKAYVIYDGDSKDIVEACFETDNDLINLLLAIKDNFLIRRIALPGILSKSIYFILDEKKLFLQAIIPQKFYFDYDEINTSDISRQIYFLDWI